MHVEMKYIETRWKHASGGLQNVVDVYHCTDSNPLYKMNMNKLNTFCEIKIQTMTNSQTQNKPNK